MNQAADSGLIIIDADTEYDDSKDYISVSSKLLRSKDQHIDPSRIAKVINARTGLEFSAQQAIDCGLIDLEENAYMHPMTGLALPLDEAVNEGHIIIKSSESFSYVIESIMDTVEGKFISAKEGIRRGLLDLKNECYVDRRTSRLLPLDTALQHGLIRIEEHTTDRTRTTYRINAVIDPITGEKVTARQAIKRGIIDLAHATYVNKLTGITRPMHEAFNEGLIIADDGQNNTSSMYSSIRSIWDPESNSEINLREAISRGIITSDLCSYIIKETSTRITLAEAIDRGLIMMADSTQEEIVESELMYEGIKSYTLRSVIDTRTGEEISMSDAIRHQIVSRERSEYIDMATDEKLTIKTAIARGLIMVTRVEDSAREVSNVDIAARVYSLKKVRDISTDCLYTPNEAESRGLINKRRGIYTDTLAGNVLSIGDAIKRGYVEAEEIEEPDYAELNETDCYATLTRSSRVSNSKDVRHIGGVVDISTGEVISILKAVQKGIIDLDAGTYTLGTTGEKLSLQNAISRGFVCDESSLPMDDRAKKRTVVVNSIYDTQQDEWISPDTAMQLGILDNKSIIFNGQKIALSEAEKLGLLKFTSENTDVHFTVETETTYITNEENHYDESITLEDAERSGLIRDGQFYINSTRKYCTIVEAINNGLISSGDNLKRTPSVLEAIEDGRINIINREFVDMGKRISVIEACAKHLLIAEHVGLKLSLREAVVRELLDTSTALFADPDTGRVYDIDTAMREGLISRENAGYNLIGGISFNKAFTSSLISEDLASFRHPKNGRLFNLDDAIKRGLVCIGPNEEMKKSNSIKDITTTSTSMKTTLVEQVTLYPNGSISRVQAKDLISNGSDYLDSSCRMDSSFESFEPVSLLYIY